MRSAATGSKCRKSRWCESPGRVKRGVLGRDVALHVNGTLGQRGAYGNAVEFAGPYVDALSMDMRFTLANMGTELGAVTSYIQPDATTRAWVEKRAAKSGPSPYPVFETDRDFEYDRVYDIDISQIEPQIAVPHAPDDVKPVSEVAGRRIDQAYLGSCASGRLEDLAVAAAVVKGRKVHPDVRFIVTPGSREVLIAATRLGYIETLHEANAIVTNANCGACPGLHGGILAPGDVAITSITRNFEGRMGLRRDRTAHRNRHRHRGSPQPRHGKNAARLAPAGALPRDGRGGRGEGVFEGEVETGFRITSRCARSGMTNLHWEHRWQK